MVRIRISGDDARKDENGIAHVGWGEAQRMAASGSAEILHGDGDERRPAPEDEYEKMTRAELDAIAAERGVDVSDARTKADVINALRAFLAEWARDEKWNTMASSSPRSIPRSAWRRR